MWQLATPPVTISAGYIDLFVNRFETGDVTMTRIVTSLRRLRPAGALAHVRRLPMAGLGLQSYVAGLLCGLCLLWSAAAGQTVFPHVGLEGAYGQGVNEVLLVVDFWPGNGTADSFAWSYRFGTSATETISGYDLLQAVQEASQGAFTVEATYFGPEWGYFIDNISYAIGPTVYQSKGWPAGFLSYWNSASPNPGWTSSWVGASFRMLRHSQADGWLNMPPPDDWTDPDGNWPKPALPPPFSNWTSSGAAPASWAQPANWSGPVPHNPGDAARLGFVIGDNNAVVRLDGQQSVGTLRIQTEVGSYRIEPGDQGILRLANNGRWATLAVAAGEHRIAAPLAVDDNLVLHVAGQSRLDVAGFVLAAHRQILKDGSGTADFRWPLLDLAGLTVAEGRVNLSSLERASQIDVGAGALLEVGYVKADSITVGGEKNNPGKLILRGISPMSQAAPDQLATSEQLSTSDQLAAPVPEPASAVLLATTMLTVALAWAARSSRR